MGNFVQETKFYGYIVIEVTEVSYRKQKLLWMSKKEDFFFLVSNREADFKRGPNKEFSRKLMAKMLLYYHI